MLNLSRSIKNFEAGGKNNLSYSVISRQEQNLNILDFQNKCLDIFCLHDIY